MVTGFRHLLANIRKSDYCSCGCNGWCSISARFFFEALASGIYPDGRHDQKPWRASDIRRRAWAGTELGFRGVIMFIKGDWPELTTTMGLPSWADNKSPCFNCLCTKAHDDIHDYVSMCLFNSPWQEATHNDYLKACATCETRSTFNTMEEIRYLQQN